MTPNTERRRRLVAYLKQGMLPSDIARLEGVSHQHIYRMIQQLGLVKETRWKETTK